MRRLPPLAAVRVFEAAARHLNFTAAAAELGMTQAAVSYQMKLLEERLGVPLFRRDGRGVALTPAGVRAAPEVSRAFDTLDGAFAHVRVDDEALLTISASQTFANAWLAWRIGRFQMENPAMAVRLLASDALVDFAREEVDVGIRGGAGDWPGLHAELLLLVDFTPMCSPDFLARHQPIVPADLLHLPLISPHDIWWSIWLKEAGLEANVAIRPGLRLDAQSHEGHAAMAGQGVAMLTPFFWRHDLAQRRLIQLFPQVSTRRFAYWAVCPAERRRIPKIRRFHEWLKKEVDVEYARYAGEAL